MAGQMSNEEFEDRSGLEVPKDDVAVGKMKQTLLAHLREMTPDARTDFVDALPPLHQQILARIEMPADLTDTNAVERWLAL